jgi:hypothetical protein
LWFVAGSTKDLRILGVSKLAKKLATLDLGKVPLSSEASEGRCSGGPEAFSVTCVEGLAKRLSTLLALVVELAILQIRASVGGKIAD